MTGNSICTCAPPGKWNTVLLEEFQFSDDVIIGDVVYYDDYCYESIVCEVYKGNLSIGEQITGVNSRSCEPYVDNDGEWILYGSYNTHFITNDCGGSTSVENPRFPIALAPPAVPNGQALKTKSQLSKVRERFILERAIELRGVISQQIALLRELAITPAYKNKDMN
ncbi:MAG: hypothetical protein WBA16_10925 [Nonlabens sp.]